MEGYQIARAVTEVKNEVKDKEQGRDIVMSDYFKTLREPLIEQQKRSDEKQDQVIEQLRENQLALTEGFKDLVETNGDVITLNKELPQIEAEPPKERITADVDNRFSQDEKNILKSFGLSMPRDLMSLPERQLKTIKETVKTHEREISPKLSGMKRRKDRSQFKDSITALENEKRTWSNFASEIDDVLSLRKFYAKPKQEEGIRKYKQPRRNAYKIQGNQYAGLMIGLPKLMEEIKLRAFQSKCRQIL